MASKNQSRFGFAQPTGQGYASDVNRHEQVPNNYTGEAGYGYAAEVAIRQGIDNMDFAAAKNTAHNNSLMPWPSAFSANKHVINSPAVHQPMTNQFDGEYVTNVTVEPPGVKKSARHAKKSNAKVSKSGARQSPAMDADALRAQFEESIRQQMAMQAQIQSARSYTTPPAAPASAPPAMMPSYMGIEQENAAPFVNVTMNEPGAIVEIPVHVSFGHVSPNDMRKESGDKKANVVSFEVPREIIERSINATYVPETGLYRPNNLSRAVITKVIMRRSNNQFPKKLLLRCPQLENAGVNGTNSSKGKRGLAILHPNYIDGKNDTVYDGLPALKNPDRVAEWGHYEPADIWKGITVTRPTKLQNGTDSTQYALVPGMHMMVTAMRKNADKDADIAKAMADGVDDSGHYKIKYAVFSRLAKTVEDTIVREMGATDLNSFHFTVSPEDETHANVFKGTEHENRPDLETFLSTPKAIDADLVLQLWVPGKRRVQDRLMTWDQVPAELRTAAV